MRCHICGCDHTIKTKSIEGYRKGVFFDIRECTECGVSWADPLEADNKIYESIYQNAEFIGGYNRYIKLANSIKTKKNPLQYIMHVEECYFCVVNSIMSDRAKNNDQFIVEIGSGLGYLTYALVTAGVKAAGIDISKIAVSAARQRFGDFYYCGTLQSFVAENNAVPTHVVCTELIEHLEDPLSFAKGVLSSLPRGGKLLITTPLKREHENTFWKADLPPVHLWWFTKKSLAAIASLTFSEVTFVDFDEYYKIKDIREVAKPPSVYEETSVLDESYGLIRPEKVPLEPLRTFVKDLLPASLVARIRNLRAGATSVPLRRSKDADIVCAVYKKM